jgi:hypothetical protein
MKFPFSFMILMVFCGQLFAEDVTTKEKIQERVNDSKRAAKQANREFEDKTCSLVNGKMVCAMKKVKHSVEKNVDKIKDAAD